MKLQIIILCIICYIPLSHSQDLKYYYSIHKADSLSIVKNYSAAGNAYLSIFISHKKNFTDNDYYNAASYFSLANQANNAFIFLDPLVKERNFNDVVDLIENKSLTNLKQTKKWAELISIIKMNQAKVEKNYNKILKAKLEQIYEDDQKYRQQLDITRNKFGENSKEVSSLERQIAIIDKINLKKVISILDQYGWVGPRTVGSTASQALYIVIQHADDNPDLQVKYLEMFRKAIMSGVSDEVINYAFLQDRVSLFKNKYQLYGTQLRREKDGNFRPLPIKDEKNVDSRRRKVGLGPLKYYLQLNKLLSQRH